MFVDDAAIEIDDSIDTDHVTSTSNESFSEESTTMEESIPSPSAGSSQSGNKS